MSHSDDFHTTKVTIFGVEYALSSAESEQYTSKISGFVDQKMNRIAKAEKMGDTTRIALMAAFEIADQIMRQRTQREKDHTRTAEAIRRLELHIDDVRSEK